MHVMEGECEKTSEMVAESAPDLVSAKTTDLKLAKEDLPPAEPEPEVPEQAAKSPSPPADPKPEEAVSEPLVNGEVKEDKSESSESAVKQEDDAAEEERTKVVEEKEDTGTKETVKEVSEVKETASGGVSEEEDRNSVTSSQSRKRGALAEVEAEGEGSSSESDAGASKRVRLEADDGEDERERLVREYVEEVTDSMEDMSRAADKLQREIGALGELLRAKELEWNSILRLRKLKEEMLERLLRRRRLANIISTNIGKEDCASTENNQCNKGGKTNNMNSLSNNNHQLQNTNNGALMMVPIVSSSPSAGHVTSSFSRGPGCGPRLGDPHPRGFRLQRPILPKPPHPPLPDHNSIVGEGRQGAILDVKSIIADYRSRHPENVPRRGRRLRPHEGGGLSRPMMEPQPPLVSSTRISGSPALMSMANMALGSGSHVRENPVGPSFMGQENSRPSSADSSRSGHHLEMLPAPGLSFKDALVQFAKMSQPPSLPAKPPPPPPPYPEVTLHPVPAPHSPPPPHSSLLHGILTKSAPTNMPAPPSQPHRATTFSPTLARLLTAPERTPLTQQNATSHFRTPASRVNICEILSSSKKNRNEITITPVSGSNKSKDDVVMLQDDEEEGDGDRLVIDESRDTAANPSELPENVPECQGCHQRAAQFVCAGCGNQWYCSRECQVSAWEEHSEMCSG